MEHHQANNDGLSYSEVTFNQQQQRLAKSLRETTYKCQLLSIQGFAIKH
jgi:hypothetical protein